VVEKLEILGGGQAIAIVAAPAKGQSDTRALGGQAADFRPDQALALRMSGSGASGEVIITTVLAILRLFS